MLELLGHFYTNFKVKPHRVDLQQRGENAKISPSIKALKMF